MMRASCVKRHLLFCVTCDKEPFAWVQCASDAFRHPSQCFCHPAAQPAEPATPQLCNLVSLNVLRTLNSQWTPGLTQLTPLLGFSSHPVLCLGCCIFYLRSPVICSSFKVQIKFSLPDGAILDLPSVTSLLAARTRHFTEDLAVPVGTGGYWFVTSGLSPQLRRKLPEAGAHADLPLALLFPRRLATFLLIPGLISGLLAEPDSPYVLCFWASHVTSKTDFVGWRRVQELKHLRHR